MVVSIAGRGARPGRLRLPRRQRPHADDDRVVLLAGRNRVVNVVLVEGPPVRHVGQGLMSPPLDEQPRLLPVALLGGHPVQLDQSRLDLWVAADVWMPSGPNAAQTWSAARQTARTKSSGPGPPRPGSAGQGVELVAPLQVAVPRHPARSAEVGVEGAVGSWVATAPAAIRSNRSLISGSWRTRVLSSERFQQLVNLGVGELPTAPGLG